MARVVLQIALKPTGMYGVSIYGVSILGGWRQRGGLSFLPRRETQKCQAMVYKVEWMAQHFFVVLLSAVPQCKHKEKKMSGGHGTPSKSAPAASVTAGAECERKSPPLLQTSCCISSECVCVFVEGVSVIRVLYPVRGGGTGCLY